jgi:hypothetical protein
LFGAGSSEASKPSRTSTEWRRTLKRVLHELDRYLIPTSTPMNSSYRCSSRHYWLPMKL